MNTKNQYKNFKEKNYTYNSSSENLIKSFQDLFLSGLYPEKNWAHIKSKPRFFINSSKIL